MKKQINHLLHDLITQVNLDYRVSPRIRAIVKQLEACLKHQNSGKTISTGSPSSDTNPKRLHDYDVEIVPFDLSPIDRQAKHNQIRIEEQDDLFCNETQQAQYLQKQKHYPQLKQDQKHDLTIIPELPEEENMERSRRLSQKILQKCKNGKKYNYLALAEGSYSYTTI